MHPDPKNGGMKKAHDGETGTHPDDFTAESERVIQRVEVRDDKGKCSFLFGRERNQISMKPQSLDGIAHRTGWTISEARNRRRRPAASNQRPSSSTDSIPW